ncbi:MAG: protein TolQ [Deltaproteobacteria bacterium]|nr:protein TolQ [Deltaproteobacteria bacterium]
MGLSWISQAGPIAFLVLGVLGLFSVVSWTIILFKYFALKKAHNTSAEFTDSFWKIKHLDQVYEESRRFEKSPLAQVFRQGYRELVNSSKDKSHDELAFQHILRKASQSEMAELESMVPFLATVGSTSPFIGLFGTVVGIMNSFQEIGLRGSASLATVAPGIAEALVATAAGLVAAIPAVIAYNYFSNRIRSMAACIDTFSNDFIHVVRKGR